MKRTLGIGLALLVILAPPALAGDLGALAEKTQRAIVALDHRVSMQRFGNPSDTQARTAGFLIEGGHVVTASRFVKGRRRFDLHLFGGLKARATVVGIELSEEFRR